MKKRSCVLIFSCLLLLMSSVSKARRRATPDKSLTMKARVTNLNYDVPVRIHWRYAGEGLGGDVVRGELTAVLPAKPKAPKIDALKMDDEDDAILDDMKLEEKVPTDRIIVKDKKYNFHYLKKGTWSPEVPVSVFHGYKFITFTLEPYFIPKSRKERPKPLRDVEIEFQFLYKGKPLKTFREKGEDGPTAGVYIPMYLISKQGKTYTDPEFISLLGGLSNYVKHRLQVLKELPWGERRSPDKYGIITDCNGYKPGQGYGVRNTNKSTFIDETKVLRELGVNGLRGCPGFFREMIDKREGMGKEFASVIEEHTQGYAVPSIRRDEKTKRIIQMPEGAGCPFNPGVMKKLPEISKAAVKKLLALPYDQVWGLTVDEIGAVFDKAYEGKGHQSICPHCIKGFRDFLKKNGLTPADFGADSWDPIMPNVYAPRFDRKPGDTWETPKLMKKLGDSGELDDKTLKLLKEGNVKKKSASKKTGSVKMPKDGFDKEKMEEDDAGSGGSSSASSWKERKPGMLHGSEPWLPEPGWSLLKYWSRRFNCYGSAIMFSEMKKACNEANQAKAKAIKEGRLDSPEAKQPWVYSFSLRGNSFLMRGHSLDFFNFYRVADNAMLYETSNRDARVWCWDSYLCEVGRSLEEKLGIEFGIYIKPHRGAPIQRLMAFASRGNGLLFWYTYGPDWHKGDSFSSNPETLKKVNKGIKLLGAVEDILYDAVPAETIRVGVVRPRASEFWSNAADKENGKWMYIALRHADVPVDALDEEMLAHDNLSKYRAICISGSNLPKKCVKPLADWVKNGGILYVNGLGCDRDEANQPLTSLLPVLGLKERKTPEHWTDVKGYGATSLSSLSKRGETPAAAVIHGKGGNKVTFKPVVGRQGLVPDSGTDVLAEFADGTAALTCHAYGKGKAYTAGFYPGLEYSEKIQRPGQGYDMSKDFDPAILRLITDPVVEHVERPVTVSVPVIEPIYVKNSKNGKRAITLINWAYQNGRNLVPFENVTINIKDNGKIKTVKSAWLQKELPTSKNGDYLTVTLPKIEEADVLVLE